MFTHIVFYKLTDASQSSIEKARDVLLGMKGKIDLIKHIEVGIDVLHSERSYHLTLFTKFESLEDFKLYKSHAIHKEVSSYMHSVMETSSSVDYIL